MTIINEEHIDRELANLAAHAYSPVVKKWLQTTAKAHLLTLEGVGRNENFRVYDAASVQALHGEPPPFDKLPDWAKDVVTNGGTLYWFDPIKVYRRDTWKRIRMVATWLNSFPHDLTFEDAARQAGEWADKVGFKP